MLEVILHIISSILFPVQDSPCDETHGHHANKQSEMFSSVWAEITFYFPKGQPWFRGYFLEKHMPISILLPHGNLCKQLRASILFCLNLFLSRVHIPTFIIFQVIKIHHLLLSFCSPSYRLLMSFFQMESDKNRAQ